MWCCFNFSCFEIDWTRVDAVSSNVVAKKKIVSTKTTTEKPTVPPAKAHVKISKSNPKQKGPKKIGKKSTLNVINIKVDVPTSNGNSTIKPQNSTYSNASKEDESSKDYTVVGEYKIFKYEDDYIKQGDCPPYWHRYDKNCYFVSRNRLDWYRASVSRSRA